MKISEENVVSKIIPKESESELRNGYEKFIKISELVDGTIDHFDLDDALDLLYQIKDIV